MDLPLKTPQVARELAATYHQVIGLVRYGKIPQPHKDSSGDYAWSPSDVAAARKALAEGGRQKAVAS